MIFIWWRVNVFGCGPQQWCCAELKAIGADVLKPQSGGEQQKLLGPSNFSGDILSIMLYNFSPELLSPSITKSWDAFWRSKISGEFAVWNKKDEQILFIFCYLDLFIYLCLFMSVGKILALEMGPLTMW